MPTVQEIIDIASVSQYKASNFLYKAGLYSGGVDKRLPRLLYMIRKSVEKRYDQDSSDTTLAKTANYLYSLCGQFGMEASYLLSVSEGGSVATPVTGGGSGSLDSMSEYLIRVVAGDFSDATHYDDERIVGHTLEIFNDNTQRFLDVGVDWVYTVAGVEFIREGFDAMVDNPRFMIFIKDPEATIEEGAGYNYNLTAITEIANLVAGNDFEQKTITIVPHGYSYTWGSSFVFSDTCPEQPGATAEDTLQVYTFRYSAVAGKWVCIAQSLNIPI
jgi:hypothetical protein